MTMGVTFVCDGFEQGLLDSGSSAFNTVPYYDHDNASIGTVARRGSKALRVCPVADYGWVRVQSGNNGTYLTDPTDAVPTNENTFTSVGVDVWSLYFRFNVLPDSDCSLFYGSTVLDDFEGSLGVAYNSDTGALRAFGRSFDGDTWEYGDDGFVPLAKVWYLLDMQVDSDNLAVDWKVDHVTQPSGSFPGATLPNPGLISVHVVGNFDNSGFANPAITEPTTSMDMNVDDWVVARGASYPMGHHEVSVLYPVRNGTHANDNKFTDDDTNSPPVDPWSRLDDVRPETTDDTDFVAQTSASAAAYMEYPHSRLPDRARGPILGCLGYLGNLAEVGGSADKVRSKLNIGGEDRWITHANNGAEPGRPDKSWSVGAPLTGFTSTDWLNELNESLMRHGYSVSVGTPTEVHTYWLAVAHRVVTDGDSLDLDQLRTGS